MTDQEPDPKKPVRKKVRRKRSIDAKEAYEIAREVADNALRQQRKSDDEAPCPGIANYKYSQRRVIGEPWAVQRADQIVGHFEEFTTNRGCVHADGIDLRCLIAANLSAARAEGVAAGLQQAVHVLKRDGVEDDDDGEADD